MIQILMWVGIIMVGLIGLAAVVSLIAAIVFYRHQIAASFVAIGHFFRAIVNPPWNNRVLGILWGLTILLFAIAIWQGGGEPIGLKMLRQASERPRDPVVEFYNRSRVINQLPAPHVSAPPDRGTWAWWEIALGSLAVSIIFIPVAMHDEIGTAWNRAWERWEQRPARIRLQPHTPAQATAPAATGQTQPPTATTVTQTIGGTFWSRLRRRFSEQLPSELVGEFLYGSAERIFRGIFRR